MLRGTGQGVEVAVARGGSFASDDAAALEDSSWGRAPPGPTAAAPGGPPHSPVPLPQGRLAVAAAPALAHAGLCAQTGVIGCRDAAQRLAVIPLAALSPAQAELMRFWISSSGTPFVSGMTFSTHSNCRTIMLE